jgi:hypothetical protein
MSPDRRSYASGNFFFELDGVTCGFIKSVEGGSASAEVINEPAGPSHYVKKHIGNPKYEDFSLQIDLSMEKSVYDWIAAAWNGKFLRRDGSIQAADYNMNIKSEREFFNALITETTIPAMDASSKEPCYLTLKFAPELTRFKKASGKLTSQLSKGVQKRWLPANFRLVIDGLDCTKVSKVDAFTVKQTVLSDPIGEMRDYQKEPGKLEFPNLTITLAESAAETWLDWHEDFLIKGNSGHDQERSGALTFLSPDLKKELARVDFFHLGIFRLAPEKPEPQTEGIKKLVVGLYCERMEFAYLGK